MAYSTRVVGRPASRVEVLESTALGGVAERQDFMHRVAAAGFGGKLFAELVPEFMQLCASLDQIVLEHLGEPAVCARAWIILRGVRGKVGVEWAGRWMLAHRQDIGEGFTADSARRLLEDAIAHGATFHAGARGWAGHNEGRHRGLSGMFFLEALASSAGFEAMQRVTSKVLPLMSEVLRGRVDAPAPLASGVVLELMDAVEGEFLLSTQPRCRRAGPYNAMDFARGFYAWATQYGRVMDSDVSAAVWTAFQERQSGSGSGSVLVAHACGYFGLRSGDDANRVLQSLRAVASPTVDIVGKGNISWPFLLVFACELRQTMNSSRVGLSGMEEVLRAPRARYANAVASLQLRLMEKSTAARGCHMVELFSAALAAVRPAPGAGRSGGSDAAMVDTGLLARPFIPPRSPPSAPAAASEPVRTLRKVGRPARPPLPDGVCPRCDNKRRKVTGGVHTCALARPRH